MCLIDVQEHLLSARVDLDACFPSVSTFTAFFVPFGSLLMTCVAWLSRCIIANSSWYVYSSPSPL
jgi:hypothetical protein